MIQKEYLTIKEISQETELSTRHIRRLLCELVKNQSELMVHRDANNHWRVHHLLLRHFKPKRVRNNKFYALSIDPCIMLTVSEIHRIMQFVVDRLDGNIEIRYTVEPKKADGLNHLHCMVKCNQKRKLIQELRQSFSRLSYDESKIFDLEGWKKYMTRNTTEITTIIKNKK